MQKTARILAALLLAAMLNPAMISCGETAADNKSAVTNAAAEVTTEAAETEPTHDENGFLLDEIPDDLDYDGRTFTILKWDHYESMDFNVEELNGEIMNDAIYERNRAAEERLNVVLEFPQITARDRGKTLLQTLQASTMSGLGAYDSAGMMSTCNASAAVAGLYINLYNIDYLDLEKPWWSDKILKNSKIAGKVYFATGDITISSLSRIMGLFVNMDMYNDFREPDLFDLVLKGDWTLDTMLDMCKDVYSDLNANGQKDKMDRFGYASDHFQMQAAFTGSNIKAFVQTQDGGLMISEDSYGERANSLIEKMSTFMQGGNDGFVITSVDDRTIFNEGRVMFFSYVMRILDTPEVRGLEYKVSFIPWPKFDAADDGYVIGSSSSITTFAVPIDVQDADVCGAVLETMASEGYRLLTPTLFEVCYKVKYNNDSSNRQAAIFDMMREDRQYDIARLFQYQVSFDPVGQFGVMIENNKNNWASTMASHQDANQKALDDIVATIAALPD